MRRESAQGHQQKCYHEEFYVEFYLRWHFIVKHAYTGVEISTRIVKQGGATVQGTICGESCENDPRSPQYSPIVIPGCSFVAKSKSKLSK